MRSQAENDGGAPRQESPCNDVATVIQQSTDDRPRCRRCGHVIFSRTSILAGAGEDCRRGRSQAVIA